MSEQLSAAYDPAQWLRQERQSMLAEAGIVANDLRRVVRKHRKLLNAKKVREFLHEGQIIQGAELDDNDVQARMVELFYDVIGVKAPRAAAAQQAIGMEVVIDPVSGQVIVRAVSATTGSGQAKA